MAGACVDDAEGGGGGGGGRGGGEGGSEKGREAGEGRVPLSDPSTWPREWMVPLIRGVLRQVHPAVGIREETALEMGAFFNAFLDAVVRAVRARHDRRRREADAAAAAAAPAPSRPDDEQLAVADVAAALSQVMLPHCPELFKHARSEGAKVARQPESAAALVWKRTAFVKRAMRMHMPWLDRRLSREEGLAVAYVQALLEYHCAELVELGGNSARDNQRQVITNEDERLAVANDDELRELFRICGHRGAFADPPPRVPVRAPAGDGDGGAKGGDDEPAPWGATAEAVANCPAGALPPAAAQLVATLASAQLGDTVLELWREAERAVPERWRRAGADPAAVDAAFRRMRLPLPADARALLCASDGTSPEARALLCGFGPPSLAEIEEQFSWSPTMYRSMKWVPWGQADGDLVVDALSAPLGYVARLDSLRLREELTGASLLQQLRAVVYALRRRAGRGESMDPVPRLDPATGARSFKALADAALVARHTTREPLGLWDPDGHARWAASFATYSTNVLDLLHSGCRTDELDGDASDYCQHDSPVVTDDDEGCGEGGPDESDEEDEVHGEKEDDDAD